MNRGVGMGPLARHIRRRPAADTTSPAYRLGTAPSGAFFIIPICKQVRPKPPAPFPIQPAQNEERNRQNRPTGYVRGGVRNQSCRGEQVERKHQHLAQHKETDTDTQEKRECAERQADDSLRKGRRCHLLLTAQRAERGTTAAIPLSAPRTRPVGGSALN